MKCWLAEIAEFLGIAALIAWASSGSTATMSRRKAVVMAALAILLVYAIARGEQKQPVRDPGEDILLLQMDAIERRLMHVEQLLSIPCKR